MKKVTRIAFLLLALAMAFSLVACKKANEPATGDSGGDADSGAARRVLRVGTTEPGGGGFIPWADGTPQAGAFLVFDALTVRIGDGRDQRLQVLKSVRWADDTTFIMELRDDVYFNNGEQMIGEDIIWSMEQSVVKGTGAQSIFGDVDFAASTVSDDGMTVTLKLFQPFGPLEENLERVRVTDKSAVENWSDDDPRWWDSPVASGPYLVSENVSGSHTTYVKRDDYWDKSMNSPWDEIIVTYFADPTAMFIAFENAEIDIASELSVQDAARVMAGNVQNAATVSYAAIPARANLCLFLTSDKPEFRDPKVREAIANALDREAIGRIAFGEGLYVLPDSVLSAGCNYYVTTGSYDRGMEYAKQCMAESNYPNGFETHVVITNMDTKVWELTQGFLGELGITLTMEAYDFFTCFPMWMEPGRTDMNLINIPGGNPGASAYQVFVGHKDHPFSAVRITDPGYNEHYQNAIRSVDSAVQAAEYAWLQQWLFDEINSIPIVEQLSVIAWHNNVIELGDGNLFGTLRYHLGLTKAA